LVAVVALATEAPQLVIAPVAGIPQIARETRPWCETSMSTP
jgi:hypothetical protein